MSSIPEINICTLGIPLSIISCYSETILIVLAVNFSKRRSGMYTEVEKHSTFVELSLCLIGADHILRRRSIACFIRVPFLTCGIGRDIASIMTRYDKLLS